MFRAAATFDLHLILKFVWGYESPPVRVPAPRSPAGAAVRHTVSDSVRVSVTRPTRDRGPESGRDGGPPHARTADDTR